MSYLYIEARDERRDLFFGLNDVRYWKSISAVEWARESGISQRSISKYKKGESTPTPETLMKLADSLELSSMEISRYKAMNEVTHTFSGLLSVISMNRIFREESASDRHPSIFAFFPKRISVYDYAAHFDDVYRLAYSTAGQFLVDYRLAQGRMSQDTLAEKVGISKGQLWKLERGKLVGKSFLRNFTKVGMKLGLGGGALLAMFRQLLQDAHHCLDIDGTPSGEVEPSVGTTSDR